MLSPLRASTREFDRRDEYPGAGRDEARLRPGRHRARTLAGVALDRWQASEDELVAWRRAVHRPRSAARIDEHRREARRVHPRRDQVANPLFCPHARFGLNAEEDLRPFANGQASSLRGFRASRSWEAGDGGRHADETCEAPPALATMPARLRRPAASPPNAGAARGSARGRVRASAPRSSAVQLREEARGQARRVPLDRLHAARPLDEPQSLVRRRVSQTAHVAGLIPHRGAGSNEALACRPCREQGHFRAAANRDRMLALERHGERMGQR
jgi:hypothetical protein